MVELSVMVGAWGFVSKLSSVICHCWGAGGHK